MTYQHPPNVARERTVLHDLIDRGRLSETTRKKYRGVVDQWVMFAGPLPSGWTRARMDAFRSQLIMRGMKAESITVYLAGLRYVAKWYASTYNAQDFSVLQPIDIPTKPPEPKRSLSPEQAERLLLTCCEGRPSLFDHRDFTMLVVGFETGLRVHGLSTMQFDRIGTSRGRESFYPSVEVGVKGRGGRRTFKVPLSDLALLAIERWRDAIGSPVRGPIVRRLVKEINHRTDETDVKITGRGISDRMIYKIVVERAERAGIGHVHPHILRHTFVTWRREAGVDLSVIATVTGHSVAVKGRDVEERGEIERYVDKEAMGEVGRKTTPPWFAQLVRKLLKEF